MAAIDEGAVNNAIKAIVNQVIPKPNDLEALGRAKLAYIGVGFLWVRSNWDVDRQGNWSFGGNASAKADIADLVKAAAAGGVPPAELSLAIKGAIERISKSEGDGIFETIVMPVVVPEGSIQDALKMLGDAVGKLVQRSTEKEVTAGAVTARTTTG